MNQKSAKCVERIIKNPHAYVSCYSTHEGAKCFVNSPNRCDKNMHFIFKVEAQFWVMSGMLARHFKNCGYEEVYSIKNNSI